MKMDILTQSGWKLVARSCHKFWCTLYLNIFVHKWCPVTGPAWFQHHWSFSELWYFILPVDGTWLVKNKSHLCLYKNIKPLKNDCQKSQNFWVYHRKQQFWLTLRPFGWLLFFFLNRCLFFNKLARLTRKLLLHASRFQCFLISHIW